MTVSIEFFGHACFGFSFEGGPSICVDPFDSETFAEFNSLHSLRDDFDFAVSTHEHRDHAGMDQLPTATPLSSPCDVEGVRISHHEVFHDEFGGRLRGGATRMLSFHYKGLHLVHVGDVGERLTEVQLDRWNPGPIDLLIVPVGGYFTLGPDGAYELTQRLTPRWVLPCHARDYGIALPELGLSRAFTERFPPGLTLRPSPGPWRLSPCPKTGTRLVILEPGRSR